MRSLPVSSGSTATAETDDDNGEAVQRVGRALRALRLSGRRLVQRRSGWEVLADGRPRPMARLLGEDVELLSAKGMLAAAEGGGYVLTAAAVEEVTAAEVEEAPRAGPWIYIAAGSRRSRRGGAGFGGLALRAQNGEGVLTLRQATAGLKLIADAEQAGRDPTLTMNWDAGPVDKQRRSAGAAGRCRAAAAAEQRIRRIRASLGTGVLPFLWSACVEQTPLHVLERRYGLPRRGAAKALGDALEKLAAAYDGQGASPG